MPEGNLVRNPDFNGLNAGKPEGWEHKAPRDEITPAFSVDRSGGRQGGRSLKIACRHQADCGWWVGQCSQVEPEAWYEFVAYLRTEGVKHVHDSVFAKLGWLDAEGKLVEKEYVPLVPGAEGWRAARGLVQAPADARSAQIELGLRWAAGGAVWWADAALLKTVPPPQRRVQVAVVTFEPSDGTPAKNRQLFAEQADKAGQQGADICCLGEAIALVGTGASNTDVAEAVPGPSTEALGQVARQRRMWIVAGVYERLGSTIYNTAVLLDRQGQLAGTYHKTHLPETEYTGGLTPGDQYPVFRTDFGTIGMQVCYDHFFPEVTRSLALNGAEMVFTPIWGDEREDGYCWDLVARARAIDNAIWYVAAKYSGRRSLIIDPWGHIRADTQGQMGIAVAHVDLNERHKCPWLSVAGRGDWAKFRWAQRRPHTYRDLLRE